MQDIDQIAKCYNEFCESCERASVESVESVIVMS